MEASFKWTYFPDISDILSIYNDILRQVYVINELNGILFKLNTINYLPDILLTVHGCVTKRQTAKPDEN